MDTNSAKDAQEIKIFINNDDFFEFLDCIKDLITSEKVQQMKNFIQHGSTTTFEHALLVSYQSFRACKKYNLNFRCAARGGLLHDLFLYDWHDKNKSESLHGFRHPSLALKNAEEAFTLTKMEKDIIKKHMWPLTIVPPKSFEAFVVCWYDKTCAVNEMQKAVCLRILLMKKYLRALYRRAIFLLYNI